MLQLAYPTSIIICSLKTACHIFHEIIQANIANQVKFDRQKTTQQKAEANVIALCVYPVLDIYLCCRRSCLLLLYGAVWEDLVTKYTKQK